MPFKLMSMQILLNKKKPFLVFTIICAIVFLQFTPLVIAGYPLTIGFLLATVVIFIGVPKKATFCNILLLLSLIATSLAIHLSGWMLGSIDFSGYWKSQAIIITSACYIFLAITGRFSLDRSDLAFALEISLAIVSAFIWLQFLTFSILGWDGLFGIFGKFSYLGISHSAITQGSIRCYGFYLEPSYCAMVVLMVGACLAVLRQLNWQWMAVILVNILFIKSAFGFVLYFILLTYFAYTKGLLAAKLTPRHIIYLAAGLSTLSVLFISGVFDPILSRFSELYTPETSGYFRFIAPAALMIDTLLNKPFGYGPGSVEAIMSLQNISMGPNETQLSLDNGIYVLILYYGVFGLLSVMYILFSSVKYFLLREDRKSFLFFMIFMSLNFTGGGIFNLEYIFLVALLFWST